MSYENTKDDYSDVPEADLEKRYERDVKSQLELIRRSEHTYVIVLAVHNNLASSSNVVRKVPTRRGIPIGGYVHDSTNDCYLVRCVDMVILGYVPISFKMQLKGLASWAVDVPVPETILRRHLSPTQRNELKKFMNNFENIDVSFEFIQMLGLN